MLVMVWGIPEPAPRAQIPRCNNSRIGTTTSGEQAKAREVGVHPSPLKAGSRPSSWSCQRSSMLKGQQASPTSTPSSDNCNRLRISSRVRKTTAVLSNRVHNEGKNGLDHGVGRIGTLVSGPRKRQGIQWCRFKSKRN